uniref:Uncharacterized protein n=1 Tax=Ditylenchus dipsaci TaxID=166011 RepID=A0A915CV52_9BILA
MVERRPNRAYSSYSTSSSESEADAEDAYLSHYLAIAASLPRFQSHNKIGTKPPPQMEKTGPRRRQTPKLITPKTAKNKSNSSSHCIVS